MKLLLVGTPEDTSYVRRFQNALGIGHSCAGIFTYKIELLTAITSQAEVKQVEGIICTNQSFLDKVLAVQPDWRAPNTRKVMSLDLFAGSLLSVTLPKSKKNIPVLICNPLSHLIQVPYAPFLFKRYLTKLTKPQNWFQPPPLTWELIDAKNFSEIRDYLASSDLIGVDCETKRQGLQIDCISYTGWKASEKESKTFLLPIAAGTSQEDYIYNLVLAREINNLPNSKVLQNGMYDSAYFARWGMPLRSYLWDTKHFFHSIYSELPKDLAYLTSFALHRVRYWKDDGKTGDLKDYFEYCCRDSWATLWTMLALLYEAPDYAIKNYLEEFPLIFPCMHAGMEGLKIDTNLWDPLQKKAEQEAKTALQELQLLVGEPAFNPGSSQQVLKLFAILGCKDLTSSDAKTLPKFSARHPLNERIGALITKYREAAKELSTYWKKEKLLEGRVLYTLDPGGTETARLASQEHQFWCGLQLQNIPSIFREAVISDTDYYLSSVDFPQSEARCVAYSSGDENLLETVESSKDYHAINVERFFGIPYAEVMALDANGVEKCINKQIRDLAKRVNHGSNYNMGPAVLLETMGVKNVIIAKQLLRLPSRLSLLQVCEELLRRYASAYPRVKRDWYANIVSTIVTTKKLISALGWTRYCFGQPDKNKRHLNSYVAHVPQNLSVGIINRCFLRIWRELQISPTNFRPDGGLKFRLKGQIHDEILFQYHKDYPEYATRVQELMIYPIPVTDCGGITRTMLIPPPPAPLDKTIWAQLK